MCEYAAYYPPSLPRNEGPCAQNRAEYVPQCVCVWLNSRNETEISETRSAAPFATY